MMPKANELDYFGTLERLPTFNPEPKIRGTIRQRSEDFDVSEFLSFQPSGNGEHLFLLIEKKDCNTDWVAKELQKQYQLTSREIGYAGKKDRYSLSRQWFSLHLPGREVSIADLDHSDFRVLKAIRHNRKLRKGAIAYNRFKLTIRALSAPLDQDRIASIVEHGFPNYFGYQRFGHHASNLEKAGLLFSSQIKVRSRNKRGLYLSAARSYLFNLMLAARVNNGTWNKALPGDCLSVDGSQSYFVCEVVEKDIQTRLQTGELHISGWLAGKQDSETTGEAAESETIAIANFQSWRVGLINAKMDSSRRPMRIMPRNLVVKSESDDRAVIEFDLPSGAFATSLLRELMVVNDAKVSAYDKLPC